jgi:hypothetical protein
MATAITGMTPINLAYEILQSLVSPDADLHRAGRWLLRVESHQGSEGEAAVWPPIRLSARCTAPRLRSLRAADPIIGTLHDSAVAIVSARFIPEILSTGNAIDVRF